MVVAGGVTGIDHAAHFGGVFAGDFVVVVVVDDVVSDAVVVGAAGGAASA